MTSYRVVGAGSISLLESFVEVELEKGWEVIGGVAVGGSGDRLQFFQALIKRDDVSWMHKAIIMEAANGNT